MTAPTPSLAFEPTVKREKGDSIGSALLQRLTQKGTSRLLTASEFLSYTLDDMCGLESVIFILGGYVLN